MDRKLSPECGYLWDVDIYRVEKSGYLIPTYTSISEDDVPGYVIREKPSTSENDQIPHIGIIYGN